MKKSKIYLFSPEIKYATFKKLWKLFPSEGITPLEMINGKHIWEMVRDKQIYLLIDPQEKDNPNFSLKLPKNKIINILK
jgi:hypothetical protein